MKTHTPSRSLLLLIAALGSASFVPAQAPVHHAQLLAAQVPPPAQSVTPSLTVDVLTDTGGADLAPYMRQVIPAVRRQWLGLLSREQLLSQSKSEHTVAIRLTVEPDGRISAMHLDTASGESALDRAAWGGISGVGQFPALPTPFSSHNLQLRINFTSPGLAAKVDSPSAAPSPAGNLHP